MMGAKKAVSSSSGGVVIMEYAVEVVEGEIVESELIEHVEEAGDPLDSIVHITEYTIEDAHVVFTPHYAKPLCTTSYSAYLQLLGGPGSSGYPTPPVLLVLLALALLSVLVWRLCAAGKTNKPSKASRPSRIGRAEAGQLRSLR
ncbi:hypothetical protein EON64_00310, partial [archaeon]